MRLSIDLSRLTSALALAAVACVFSISAACASPSTKSQGAHPTHNGRGVVVAVDATKGRVKIDHEKIEGWMDAMTMWFDVKDPKMLEGIAPNDKVEFVVTEEDSADVVTEIRKAG